MKPVQKMGRGEYKIGSLTVCNNEVGVQKIKGKHWGGEYKIGNLSQNRAKLVGVQNRKSVQKWGGGVQNMKPEQKWIGGEVK